MAKRDRAVLALLILIFLASILIGVPVAIFGSQSDTSPGEQAAALFFGIGLIVSGIWGLVGATRAQSKAGLRVPLVCAGGAIVAFLLVLVYGS